MAIGVANFAYLIAVMQRSSLSVASLEAANRFNIDATALASLAVFQLVTYAAMQVPAGIFLDRFGPRIVISAGAVTMAFGQLIVGQAHIFQIAVLGRMLVGIGDACTFISMIRVVNLWVSGTQASKIQQWVATIGQLGQVLSAIPFVAWLGIVGWSTAFTTLSLIAFLSAIAVVAFLSENLQNTVHSVDLRTVVVALRRNAKRHPVRMGFWTHFTNQSAGAVFALLWGVPFVLEAQGYPKVVASALLTIFTITNATLGPVIGYFAARHHSVQKWIIISAPLLGLAGWSAALLQPAQSPIWLLVILVVLLGIGGPSSMLAFDYTRRYVKPSELGVANGFVNIGGFLASLVMMAGIGILLDLQHSLAPGSSLFGLEHFRLALLFQYLIVLGGLGAYLYESRKTLQVEGIRE